MLFNFDNKLLLNDFKLMRFNYCVNWENIINLECSEIFPNRGFMPLIFPIRKALGPLPKIAKKIPDGTKAKIFLLILGGSISDLRLSRLNFSLCFYCVLNVTESFFTVY